MFTEEVRKKLKIIPSKSLSWIYPSAPMFNIGAVLALPLWIWLSAALAYFLIINWSFNPRRNEKNLSSFRTFSLPLFATISAVAFWLKYREAGSWWWLILIFVILGANYGMAAAKKIYSDNDFNEDNK